MLAPMARSASSRRSMALSASWLRRVGKLNVPIYRMTRGRVFGTVGGSPVLLLTTTGRKSGEPRTAPVLYIRDGERLLVIGSNAGNAKTPAWALNLRAKPDAEINVRGRSRPVTARVAEGEERDRLWKTITDEYPGFDDYRERTDREIAVFVLEPRSRAG